MHVRLGYEELGVSHGIQVPNRLVYEGIMWSLVDNDEGAEIATYYDGYEDEIDVVVLGDEEELPVYDSETIAFIDPEVEIDIYDNDDN